MPTARHWAVMSCMILLSGCTPGAHPSVAGISADPNNRTAPLTVVFNGSGSRNSNRFIKEYLRDFGCVQTGVTLLLNKTSTEEK